jgi:methyl-accepting chemotaxis protein
MAIIPTKKKVSNLFGFHSVRARILFWGGISLILIAGFIIGYAAVTVRDNALTSTKQEISGLADTEARIITAQLEIGLDTTRSFAHALAGAKDAEVPLNRDDVIAMLYRIVKENPQFVGMASCWEPDAFDGKDREFVHSKGHDETGRFIPYFGRGSSGEIILEPLVDYETPGAGDWYLIPRNTKMETIVEPYLYPIQGRDVLMTTTDAPIIRDGTFLGVITADINLEDFQKMADSIDAYEGSARMYIISNGGYIVAATGRSELIGKHLSESSLSQLDIADITASLKIRSGGSKVDEDAIKAISVFTPGRTNTPWLIFLTVPAYVATSSANMMVLILVGIGIIFIIIGLGLLYITTARITRPIQDITADARKISQGDITLTSQIKTDDEIGVLSQAFSDVVSTLHLFRNEIQKISSAVSSGDLDVRGDTGTFQGEYAVIIEGMNDLVDAMALPLNEAIRVSKQYASGNFGARVNSDLNFEGEFVPFRDALDTIGTDVSKALTAVKRQMEDLAVQMDEVTSSVNGITRETQEAYQSIEDVSQGVNHVALIASAVRTMADRGGVTTRQIHTAMEDLGTTVLSVGNRIELVSDLTRNAAALSEKGKQSAGLAESGMQRIMSSSSAIDQMNQDISVQMQEIDRIVDIISSIAEETNLLALNAAIEAARAGDAGRGFAVVASEVKELANESQKSAENIAGIISGLQKKSQDMAHVIQESISEVKGGNVAVNETLAVFNDIVEAITVIHSGMNEVAQASIGQSSSVEEVTSTITEFSRVIKNTTDEAADLAKASEESSAAVTRISGMVARVNESMDTIRTTTRQVGQEVKRIEKEMDGFRF